MIARRGFYQRLSHRCSNPAIEFVSTFEQHLRFEEKEPPDVLIEKSVIVIYLCPTSCFRSIDFDLSCLLFSATRPHLTERQHLHLVPEAGGSIQEPLHEGNSQIDRYFQRMLRIDVLVISSCLLRSGVWVGELLAPLERASETPDHYKNRWEGLQSNSIAKSRSGQTRKDDRPKRWFADAWNMTNHKEIWILFFEVRVLRLHTSPTFLEMTGAD